MNKANSQSLAGGELACVFTHMISNDFNFKKSSENKEFIENSFFSKIGLSNINQNDKKTYSRSELNRIKVFRHIEKNQPINIYQVSKDLCMSYNTISYIVRDLIFAGVVSEKMSINKNNVAEKILSIPEVTK